MEIRLGFQGPEGPTEQSISVTMRTPGDDFELAVGFLFTEGVIADPGDVHNIEHCGPPSPDKGIRNVVKVSLADHVRFDPGHLLRHFFTSSSCGVCGKASLDAVRVQIPPGEHGDFAIAAADLKTPARHSACRADRVRPYRRDCTPPPVSTPGDTSIACARMSAATTRWTN